MTEPIRRGWVLTAFLLVAGLLSIFGIVFWSGASRPELASQIPLPLWVSHAFLVMSIFRLLATIAIWYWFREGVITYVILTLVAIPIAASVGFLSTIVSLIGIALLLFLVRDKWGRMRWLLAPPNNRWRDP
jgi:hypothetical protein